jgi:hypothetical protein
MNACELLRKAADTIEQRAAQRDTEQERSMNATVVRFNAATGHSLTEVEGWYFMECLKRSRASKGGFCEDDWIDLVAYAALEAECAINQQA